MNIVRKYRNNIIPILPSPECRNDSPHTASRKHVKNLLAAATVLAECWFLFRLNALSVFKENTKEPMSIFSMYTTILPKLPKKRKKKGSE